MKRILTDAKKWHSLPIRRLMRYSCDQAFIYRIQSVKWERGWSCRRKAIQPINFVFYTDMFYENNWINFLLTFNVRSFFLVVNTEFLLSDVCEPDWQFNSVNNFCYLCNSAAVVHYARARNKCIEEEGTLTSILNQDEQSFIEGKNMEI